MGAVGEVPGIECGEHVLELHRTEDERLAGLTAWVRRGLDLGQKVIAPSRRAGPRTCWWRCWDARSG